MRAEIVAQKLSDRANEKKMCEADRSTIVAATEQFARHFKWNAGEYSVRLLITTDGGIANVSQKYRFSLFESDENDLRSVVDRYPYGEGVYYPSEGPAVFVQMHKT